MLLKKYPLPLNSTKSKGTKWVKFQRHGNLPACINLTANKDEMSKKLILDIILVGKRT